MSINCNYDCFNCTLPDCCNDSSVRQEIMHKYNHSEKGKARMNRYNNSDKGKERQKRYNNSPKGKERSKRALQKAIASGKNAERCRKYYWRKKGIEID